MKYSLKFIELVISIAAGWAASVFFDAPSIYSALLSLLVFLVASIFELQQKQERVIKSIESIDRQIIPIGYKRFQFHEDFYAALNEATKSAKTEILATHLRHEAPPEYTSKDVSSCSVKLWTSAHKNGIFKRISCRANQDMSEYCDSQEKLAKQIPNYHFRAIDWSSPFSNINFALIDRTEVFISLSGSVGQETAGLYINDKKAALYFREYFETAFNRN